MYQFKNDIPFKCGVDLAIVVVCTNIINNGKFTNNFYILFINTNRGSTDNFVILLKTKIFLRKLLPQEGK